MGKGSLGLELEKHPKQRFLGRGADEALRLCNFTRQDFYKLFLFVKNHTYKDLLLKKNWTHFCSPCSFRESHVFLMEVMANAPAMTMGFYFIRY